MNITCKICKSEFETGKKLSNHIQSVHKITSLQYTVEHFCQGTRPVCHSCGEETRYSSFLFKKYCQSCSLIAMKEGGRNGGKSSSWNKGKTANEDLRILELSEKLSGSGNPFWGKKHSDASRDKISKSKRLQEKTIEERLLERSNELLCLTSSDEYLSRQHQYLNFQCLICNKINEKTLQSFERGSLCEFCYPVTSSKWQLEIEKWLVESGHSVVREDRTIISPKEIDIFLSEHKLGIECHGLYFHSDAKKDNNQKLHSQKAALAEKSGIKLLQIFQDEWINRQEIVKQMILYRMGIHNKSIGARKCKIVKLTSKEQRDFFAMSHLSGYSPAHIAWGLQYEDCIIACLSLRVPRQKKWKERFEVSRFAIKPGYSVPGALSRLVNEALTYSKFKEKIGIMTYVDKRVGEGRGYLSAGFLKVGETGPDYWYTDFSKRLDRFKFRAQNGKSESCVAKENKVFKIWGAGSNIFVLDSR